MSNQLYEIIAMLMRYVFVALGVLILLRALIWMRRDARNYSKEMRMLPDAGLVGEIVDLVTGKSQPLPREGTVGSGRYCDICLKYNGMKRCHALIAFEEGCGVRITPHRCGKIFIDGKQVSGVGYALHGTKVILGEAEIRFRLFAGLNVPHPLPYESNTYGLVYDGEQEEEESLPPIEMPPYRMPDPLDSRTTETQAAGYDGGYDEDGEMTWQFAAYPLEELRRAQQEMDRRLNEAEATEEADDAVPYQSPLARPRRRDRY